MTIPRVLLAALLVLLLAVPALAWGPLDGAYQVTEAFPGGLQVGYYVIALQNGNQVGIVSLPVRDARPDWINRTVDLGYGGDPA
jgi:hypothetical protein